MSKGMKRLVIILLVLAAVGVGLFFGGKMATKRHSPEQTEIAKIGANTIEVFYCSPSKKGREIFGELVPFDKVWRTGANEATTFSTQADLTIDDKMLKKGKYTLWTVPGPETWKVIFNSEMYGWGVTFGNEATRDPKFDVLELEVPVETVSGEPVESFSISLTGENPCTMALEWDETRISVPIY